MDPGDAAAKEAMIHLMEEHYLWPDLLPSEVDLGQYPTLHKLLNHLTENARRRGLDRYWSFVQRKDGQPSLVAYDPKASAEVSLGMLSRWRGFHFMVGEVLPGSGAAAAGIARGDEVLAMASSQAGLADPASQVINLVGSGKWEILDPGRPGVTVHLRLRKGGTGLQADVAATTGLVSLDLVPNAGRPLVLDAGGGHRVGYLRLRAFKVPAENLLREAFGHLRADGATDLIVDLRYNGGGTVSTVSTFADLMRADQHRGDVQMRYRHSPKQRARDSAHFFSPEPNALRLGRIAFIVDKDSASASEALPNILAPYFHQNLALVGRRTSGKPVGMEPMPIPGSGWELYLVNFALYNASGAGDYFQGLPYAGFAGTSCLADDDLGHALGDPAEASTAAALRWIAHGTSAQGPIPQPAAVHGLAHEPEPALPGRDPDLPGLL